jgi:plastocyanin
MRRVVPALLVLIVPVALAHAAETTTVTASGASFTPKSVTVQVGGTVHWQNGGGNHNVAFDDGSYRSGDPTTKDSIGDRTFDTAGTFQYHCEVHGATGGLGMSGTVVVGDGTGPEPTTTPTATPEPTPDAPALSSLVVRRHLSHGRIRGSVQTAPDGADLKIVVTRRGIVVGSHGYTAGGNVSFAVRLAQSVRDGLKDGKHPKVRVTATLTSGTATVRRHRSVRLRD